MDTPSITQEKKVDLTTNNTTPLHVSVEQSINEYFDLLKNTQATNIYDMVIAETEKPLIKAVMKHAQNNQSKAAILLGMSRGTLRKKLKDYQINE